MFFIFVHNYFWGNKFLYILFEEANCNDPSSNHRFLGFKWFDFDDMERDCRKTWETIRSRIHGKTLVLEKAKIYQGVQTYAPNFPKQSDHNIFVRGTNSKDKKSGEYKTKWVVNGVEMHLQSIWAKGECIVKILKDTPFI